MTTTDEFATFRRDDQVNQARWLSGLMFETSTDRLKAFVEVLGLLEQQATDAKERSPLWDGAQVIVDAERDYWDLQPDGRYKMRANSSATMTARHIEACYSPIKVIATSSMNGAAS